MTPSVENKEFLDVKYPTINLLDDRPFSSDIFDLLARRTAYSELFRVSLLRFMVANDRLVAFPRTLDIDSVRILVDQLGRKLQSAGSLDVLYDPRGRTIEREIYGHSKTLQGLVPIEESNRYKEEIIAKYLSRYFEVR